MSRIGRQPIPVPSGVTVAIEPESVRVNGPRGELVERIGQRRSLHLVEIDHPANQQAAADVRYEKREPPAGFLIHGALAEVPHHDEEDASGAPFLAVTEPTLLLLAFAFAALVERF